MDIRLVSSQQKFKGTPLKIPLFLVKEKQPKYSLVFTHDFTIFSFN